VVIEVFSFVISQRGPLWPSSQVGENAEDFSSGPCE
jgi:hypothetical protein